jgi:hypothetical protein
VAREEPEFYETLQAVTAGLSDKHAACAQVRKEDNEAVDYGEGDEGGGGGGCSVLGLGGGGPAAAGAAGDGDGDGEEEPPEVEAVDEAEQSPPPEPRGSHAQRSDCLPD